MGAAPLFVEISCINQFWPRTLMLGQVLVEKIFGHAHSLMPRPCHGVKYKVKKISMITPSDLDFFSFVWKIWVFSTKYKKSTTHFFDF